MKINKLLRVLILKIVLNHRRERNGELNEKKQASPSFDSIRRCFFKS